MTDGFLTRWSRRKLEDRVEPEAQPSGTPTDDAAEPAALQPETADEAITAEEIAALPAISDITAATDITAFLRKGVPAILRNAALQRLWVLDPSIRDFIGEARDYAWDWNTPGGVPVSGPLETGTDIPAMLRRIFGEEAESARENVIAQIEPAPHAPPREPFAPSSPGPEVLDPQAAESRILSADNVEDENGAPVRRHGSALPV
jgi:hypothetical protein